MDDNTAESNEYFLLVITSESLPNKFSPGDPDKTNITIVGNDGESVWNHIEIVSTMTS